VLEKLEKIKHQQRIHDQYIDLALTQPNIFAREYRGYRLSVGGRNMVGAAQRLCALGKTENWNAEVQAAGDNRAFYEGDIATCVVVIPEGAYVAVRIERDVYYFGVKNKDRIAVLATARRSKTIYDCRDIRVASLADYGDNVVAFAF
jgi:hypothetical protein